MVYALWLVVVRGGVRLVVRRQAAKPYFTK
jgi:hypothetical protein